MDWGYKSNFKEMRQTCGSPWVSYFTLPNVINPCKLHFGRQYFYESEHHTFWRLDKLQAIPYLSLLYCKNVSNFVDVKYAGTYVITLGIYARNWWERLSLNNISSSLIRLFVNPLSSQGWKKRRRKRKRKRRRSRKYTHNSLSPVTNFHHTLILVGGSKRRNAFSSQLTSTIH